MKKLKCFLFVAAVALVLAGCRKPVGVSLSTTSQEVEAQGGSFDVELKSNGEWNIGTPDWIAVSPTSGTGDATLKVTVNANLTAESRVGEVKAATKDNTATLTVTQGFVDEEAYIVVSPDSIECEVAGGDYSVSVASNIDWVVSEVPNWLTCTPMEGSGNGTISLKMELISDGLVGSHQADLVIGDGETFAILHVSQKINLPTVISLSPKNLDMPYDGASKTVAVTCGEAWSASIVEDWVTFDLTQGEGNADVLVTASENPKIEPRVTSVEFVSASGMRALLTIKQDAAPDPHHLEVSPLSFDFDKQGGTQMLTISCDAEWVVESLPDWLSLPYLQGNGDVTLALTAQANEVVEPRAASFVVSSETKSQRVSVTQAAGDQPVYVTLAPDTLSAAYTGSSSVMLEVTSNTTWALEASPWISIMSANPSQGDATVYLIVDYNSSDAPRYGFIRAKHNGAVMDEIVVAQDGKPDLLETDITETTVRPEGGQFTFHVTSNQNWALVIDVPWLTCSPTNGFGNGVVTVTVDAMMGARPRTGHIRIKADSGKLVEITVVQQP